MRNNILKPIALVVALAFFIEQIAYAAPSPVIASEAPVIPSSAPAAGGKQSLELNFTLPPSVASIEESFKAGDQTLYLIQDAHTNESGQMNLSNALEVLLDNENIRYVFTEAGIGDNSLIFLRSFGNLEERKRVGLSFLRKGEIKGSEYLSLASDRDFVLWGVEDKTLYAQSLEAYRDVVEHKDTWINYLKKIQNTFMFLKPRVLNPFLLEFFEQHEAYTKNESSLTEYFEVLKKTALKQHLSLKDFPHLKLMEGIKNKEAQIDFKAAQVEQENAVASLSNEDQKKLLSSSKKHALHKLSLQKDKSQEAYYALLEEHITSRNDYPELFKYFDYLKEAESLNAKGVLQELELLEKAVYRALTQNPEEKKYLKFAHHIGVLERLLNFQLTPDEFLLYQKKKEDFDPVVITAFLNTQIMNLNSHFERAILLEEGLKETLKKAEDFYKLTTQRDLVFLDRSLQKMKEENQEKAILITGGFHTPNLKKLLRDKNVSYVSITPQVLHETNHQRYERLLLGQTIGTYKGFDVAKHHKKRSLKDTAVMIWSAVNDQSETPKADRDVVPRIGQSLGASPRDIENAYRYFVTGTRSSDQPSGQNVGASVKEDRGNQISRWFRTGLWVSFFGLLIVIPIISYWHSKRLDRMVDRLDTAVQTKSLSLEDQTRIAQEALEIALDEVEDDVLWRAFDRIGFEKGKDWRVEGIKSRAEIIKRLITLLIHFRLEKDGVDPANIEYIYPDEADFYWWLIENREINIGIKGDKPTRYYRLRPEKPYVEQSSSQGKKIDENDGPKPVSGTRSPEEEAVKDVFELLAAELDSLIRKRWYVRELRTGEGMPILFQILVMSTRKLLQEHPEFLSDEDASTIQRVSEYINKASDNFDEVSASNALMVCSKLLQKDLIAIESLVQDALQAENFSITALEEIINLLTELRLNIEHFTRILELTGFIVSQQTQTPNLVANLTNIFLAEVLSTYNKALGLAVEKGLMTVDGVPTTHLAVAEENKIVLSLTLDDDLIAVLGRLYGHLDDIAVDVYNGQDFPFLSRTLGRAYGELNDELLGIIDEVTLFKGQSDPETLDRVWVRIRNFINYDLANLYKVERKRRWADNAPDLSGAEQFTINSHSHREVLVTVREIFGKMGIPQADAARVFGVSGTRRPKKETKSLGPREAVLVRLDPGEEDAVIVMLGEFKVSISSRWIEDHPHPVFSFIRTSDTEVKLSYRTEAFEIYRDVEGKVANFLQVFDSELGERHKVSVRKGDLKINTMSPFSVRIERVDEQHLKITNHEDKGVATVVTGTFVESDDLLDTIPINAYRRDGPKDKPKGARGTGRTSLGIFLLGSALSILVGSVNTVAGFIAFGLTFIMIWGVRHYLRHQVADDWLQRISYASKVLTYAMRNTRLDQPIWFEHHSFQETITSQVRQQIIDTAFLIFLKLETALPKLPLSKQAPLKEEADKLFDYANQMDKQLDIQVGKGSWEFVQNALSALQETGLYQDSVTLMDPLHEETTFPIEEGIGIDGLRQFYPKRLTFNSYALQFEVLTRGDQVIVRRDRDSRSAGSRLSIFSILLGLVLGIFGGDFIPSIPKPIQAQAVQDPAQRHPGYLAESLLIAPEFTVPEEVLIATTDVLIQGVNEMVMIKKVLQDPNTRIQIRLHDNLYEFYTGKLREQVQKDPNDFESKRTLVLYERLKKTRRFQMNALTIPHRDPANHELVTFDILLQRDSYIVNGEIDRAVFIDILVHELAHVVDFYSKYLKAVRENSPFPHNAVLEVSAFTRAITVLEKIIENNKQGKNLTPGQLRFIAELEMRVVFNQQQKIEWMKQVPKEGTSNLEGTQQKPKVQRKERHDAQIKIDETSNTPWMVIGGISLFTAAVTLITLWALRKPKTTKRLTKKERRQAVKDAKKADKKKRKKGDKDTGQSGTRLAVQRIAQLDEAAGYKANGATGTRTVLNPDQRALLERALQLVQGAISLPIIYPLLRRIDEIRGSDLVSRVRQIERYPNKKDPLKAAKRFLRLYHAAWRKDGSPEGSVPALVEGSFKRRFLRWFKILRHYPRRRLWRGIHFVDQLLKREGNAPVVSFNDLPAVKAFVERTGIQFKLFGALEYLGDRRVEGHSRHEPTLSGSFKRRQLINFIVENWKKIEQGVVKEAIISSSGNAIQGLLYTVKELKEQGIIIHPHWWEFWKLPGHWLSPKRVFLPQDFQVTMVADDDLSPMKEEQVRSKYPGHFKDILKATRFIALGKELGVFDPNENEEELKKKLEYTNWRLERLGELVAAWNKKHPTEQIFHIQPSNGFSQILGGASILHNIRRRLKDFGIMRGPDVVMIGVGGGGPALGMAIDAYRQRGTKNKRTQVIGVKSQTTTESLGDGMAAPMAHSLAQEALTLFEREQLELMQFEERFLYKAYIDLQEAGYKVEPSAAASLAMIYSMIADPSKHHLLGSQDEEKIFTMTLTGANDAKGNLQLAREVYDREGMGHPGYLLAGTRVVIGEGSWEYVGTALDQLNQTGRYEGSAIYVERQTFYLSEAMHDLSRLIPKKIHRNAQDLQFEVIIQEREVILRRLSDGGLSDIEGESLGEGGWDFVLRTLTELSKSGPYSNVATLHQEKKFSLAEGMEGLLRLIPKTETFNSYALTFEVYTQDNQAFVSLFKPSYVEAEKWIKRLNDAEALPDIKQDGLKLDAPITFEGRTYSGDLTRADRRQIMEDLYELHSSLIWALHRLPSHIAKELQQRAEGLYAIAESVEAMLDSKTGIRQVLSAEQKALVASLDKRRNSVPAEMFEQGILRLSPGDLQIGRGLLHPSINEEIGPLIAQGKPFLVVTSAKVREQLAQFGIPHLDAILAKAINVNETHFRDLDGRRRELYEEALQLNEGRAPESVFAFGAGSVSDWAKVFAQRFAVDHLIMYPSTNSTNAPYSAHAVIREHFKGAEDFYVFNSVVTGAAKKIIVDLDFMRSNKRGNIAGTGDLLSAWIAITDADFAAAHNSDEKAIRDEYDWLYKEMKVAMQRLIDNAEAIRQNSDEGMRVVAELNNTVTRLMEILRSGQPKAGLEHALSNAIEASVVPFPHRDHVLHGEQVAVSCFLMAYLYSQVGKKGTSEKPFYYVDASGQDRTVEDLRQVMISLGLPLDLKTIGLTEDDLLEGLLRMGKFEQQFGYFDVYGVTESDARDAVHNFVSGSGSRVVLVKTLKEAENLVLDAYRAIGADDIVNAKRRPEELVEEHKQRFEHVLASMTYDWRFLIQPRPRMQIASMNNYKQLYEAIALRMEVSMESIQEINLDLKSDSPIYSKLNTATIRLLRVYETLANTTDLMESALILAELKGTLQEINSKLDDEDTDFKLVLQQTLTEVNRVLGEIIIMINEVEGANEDFDGMPLEKLKKLQSDLTEQIDNRFMKAAQAFKAQHEPDDEVTGLFIKAASETSKFGKTINGLFIRSLFVPGVQGEARQLKRSETVIIDVLRSHNQSSLLWLDAMRVKLSANPGIVSGQHAIVSGHVERVEMGRNTFMEFRRVADDGGDTKLITVGGNGSSLSYSSTIHAYGIKNAPTQPVIVKNLGFGLVEITAPDEEAKILVEGKVLPQRRAGSRIRAAEAIREAVQTLSSLDEYLKGGEVSKSVDRLSELSSELLNHSQETQYESIREQIASVIDELSKQGDWRLATVLAQLRVATQLLDRLRRNNAEEINQRDDLLTLTLNDLYLLADEAVSIVSNPDEIPDDFPAGSSHHVIETHTGDVSYFYEVLMKPEHGNNWGQIYVTRTNSSGKQVHKKHIPGHVNKVIRELEANFNQIMERGVSGPLGSRAAIQKVVEAINRIDITMPLAMHLLKRLVDRYGDFRVVEYREAELEQLRKAFGDISKDEIESVLLEAFEGKTFGLWPRKVLRSAISDRTVDLMTQIMGKILVALEVIDDEGALQFALDIYAGREEAVARNHDAIEIWKAAFGVQTLEEIVLYIGSANMKEIIQSRIAGRQLEDQAEPIFEKMAGEGRVAALSLALSIARGEVNGRTVWMVEHLGELRDLNDALLPLLQEFGKSGVENYGAEGIVNLLTSMRVTDRLEHWVGEASGSRKTKKAATKAAGGTSKKKKKKKKSQPAAAAKSNTKPTPEAETSFIELDASEEAALRVFVDGKVAAADVTIGDFAVVINPYSKGGAHHVVVTIAKDESISLGYREWIRLTRRGDEPGKIHVRGPEGFEVTYDYEPFKDLGLTKGHLAEARIFNYGGHLVGVMKSENSNVSVHARGKFESSTLPQFKTIVQYDLDDVYESEDAVAMRGRVFEILQAKTAAALTLFESKPQIKEKLDAMLQVAQGYKWTGIPGLVFSLEYVTKQGSKDDYLLSHVDDKNQLLCLSKEIYEGLPTDLARAEFVFSELAGGFFEPFETAKLFDENGRTVQELKDQFLKRTGHPIEVERLSKEIISYMTRVFILGQLGQEMSAEDKASYNKKIGDMFRDAQNSGRTYVRKHFIEPIVAEVRKKAAKISSGQKLQKSVGVEVTSSDAYGQVLVSDIMDGMGRLWYWNSTLREFIRHMRIAIHDGEISRLLMFKLYYRVINIGIALDDENSDRWVKEEHAAFLTEFREFVDALKEDFKTAAEQFEIQRRVALSRRTHLYHEQIKAAGSLEDVDIIKKLLGNLLLVDDLKAGLSMRTFDNELDAFTAEISAAHEKMTQQYNSLVEVIQERLRGARITPLRNTELVTRYYRQSTQLSDKGKAMVMATAASVYRTDTQGRVAVENLELLRRGRMAGFGFGNQGVAEATLARVVLANTYFDRVGNVLREVNLPEDAGTDNLMYLYERLLREENLIQALNMLPAAIDDLGAEYLMELWRHFVRRFETDNSIEHQIAGASILLEIATALRASGHRMDDLNEELRGAIGFLNRILTRQYEWTHRIHSAITLYTYLRLSDLPADAIEAFLADRLRDGKISLSARLEAASAIYHFRGSKAQSASQFLIRVILGNSLDQSTRLQLGLSDRMMAAIIIANAELSFGGEYLATEVNMPAEVADGAYDLIHDAVLGTGARGMSAKHITALIKKSELMTVHQDTKTNIEIAIERTIRNRIQDAVPFVARALNHEDESIRRQAALALVKFGMDDRVVVENLIQVAGDEREAIDIRVAAIEALGNINPQTNPNRVKVIRLLTAGLKQTDNRDLCLKSAWAMRSMGEADDEAVSLLAEEALDQEKPIEHLSMLALNEMLGPEKGAEKLKEHQQKRAEVDELKASLTNVDNLTMKALGEKFMGLEYSSAYLDGVLLEVLPDNAYSFFGRILAIQLLGKIAYDPDVVIPHLIKGFDYDKDFPPHIAISLARFAKAHKKAEEGLYARLMNPGNNQIITAILIGVSTYKVNSGRFIPIIIDDILMNQHSSEELRRQSALALNRYEVKDNSVRFACIKSFLDLMDQSSTWDTHQALAMAVLSSLEIKSSLSRASTEERDRLSEYLTVQGFTGPSDLDDAALARMREEIPNVIKSSGARRTARASGARVTAVMALHHALAEVNEVVDILGGGVEDFFNRINAATGGTSHSRIHRNMTLVQRLLEAKIHRLNMRDLDNYAAYRETGEEIRGLLSNLRTNIAILNIADFNHDRKQQLIGFLERAAKFLEDALGVHQRYDSLRLELINTPEGMNLQRHSVEQFTGRVKFLIDNSDSATNTGVDPIFYRYRMRVAHNDDYYYYTIENVSSLPEREDTLTVKRYSDDFFIDQMGDTVTVAADSPYDFRLIRLMLEDFAAYDREFGGHGSRRTSDRNTSIAFDSMPPTAINSVVADGADDLINRVIESSGARTRTLRNMKLVSAYYQASTELSDAAKSRVMAMAASIHRKDEVGREALQGMDQLSRGALEGDEFKLQGHVDSFFADAVLTEKEAQDGGLLAVKWRSDFSEYNKPIAHKKKIADSLTLLELMTALDAQGLGHEAPYEERQVVFEFLKRTIQEQKDWSRSIQAAMIYFNYLSVHRFNSKVIEKFITDQLSNPEVPLKLRVEAATSLYRWPGSSVKEAGDFLVKLMTKKLPRSAVTEALLQSDAILAATAIIDATDAYGKEYLEAHMNTPPGVVDVANAFVDRVVLDPGSRLTGDRKVTGDFAGQGARLVPDRQGLLLLQKLKAFVVGVALLGVSSLAFAFEGPAPSDIRVAHVQMNQTNAAGWVKGYDLRSASESEEGAERLAITDWRKARVALFDASNSEASEEKIEIHAARRNLESEFKETRRDLGPLLKEMQGTKLFYTFNLDEIRQLVSEMEEGLEKDEEVEFQIRGVVYGFVKAAQAASAYGVNIRPVVVGEWSEYENSIQKVLDEVNQVKRQVEWMEVSPTESGRGQVKVTGEFGGVVKGIVNVGVVLRLKKFAATGRALVGTALWGDLKDAVTSDGQRIDYDKAKASDFSQRILSFFSRHSSDSNVSGATLLSAVSGREESAFEALKLKLLKVTERFGLRLKIMRMLEVFA